MSTIDSMTGVYIQSDFFDNAPTLELFPAPTANKHFRAALLYGKNGSGKSTVAQGFREYKNSVATPTVLLSPRKSGATIPTAAGTPEKFFVFDEEYVTSRVRIEGAGLDAIVLFGEQIDLDAQITQTQTAIVAKQTEVDQQVAECTRFTEGADVISPDHWFSLITNELGKTDGWARTDSRIKGNVARSAVPPAIDRIGQLVPDKNRVEIQALFDERFLTFATAATASAKINAMVATITIVGDRGRQAKELLARVIARPQWTEREQQIFDLLGGHGLDNSRIFLANTDHTVCDKCLQPISEQYRTEVLEELEHILNHETEEFKGELRRLLIPEIANTAYEAYHNLRSYCEVRDSLDDYIRAVSAHNAAVQKKINNPFELVVYDEAIGVMAAYSALNQALTALEADRVLHNRSIDERDTVKLELVALNDALAHYAIKDMFDSLQRQRAAKTAADARLHELRTELDELNAHMIQLNAQRQNFELAAKDINRSLEYIFYCKERLELKLEADQKYHLKTNGRPVNPKKVSCGERNALALSYFFTEIIKDMNAGSGYMDELFLVIDDPISSFDFENRIGVLSLLRWKLEEVLDGCATSKVLVMTHDIQTAFDVEKGFKDISERFNRKIAERKRTNPRDNTPLESYSMLRLEARRVESLTNIQKNEYTQLLERIYEYAKNGGDGLVIGNIMRRVLEAFSTFSYKKGIADLSADDSILAPLSETPREYFKNLMYKLVLNGDSHLLERVQGMRDYGFSSFLSDDDKKRTARDILCLMYLLNGSHVMAHLPGAKLDIEGWITSISPTTPAEQESAVVGTH